MYVLIISLLILGILCAVAGVLLLRSNADTFYTQRQPICPKCGGCVWIIWRDNRWDCINLVKKGNKIVECSYKLYFI